MPKTSTTRISTVAKIGRRTLTLASHCMMGLRSLHAGAVAERRGRGEHDALARLHSAEDRDRAGLGVAREDDALLGTVAVDDEDAAGVLVAEQRSLGDHGQLLRADAELGAREHAGPELLVRVL